MVVMVEPRLTTLLVLSYNHHWTKVDGIVKYNLL